MRTISTDELYARFLHLQKLVIERPIGSYGWPDETPEYFEVRESIYGNRFVRAGSDCAVHAEMSRRALVSETADF